MLRSKHHVGGSEEGVGSGGEDGDVIAFNIKTYLCADGFSDPVGLEEFDGFWPI